MDALGESAGKGGESAGKGGETNTMREEIINVVNIFWQLFPPKYEADSG
jgi:hypothetical protein